MQVLKILGHRQNQDQLHPFRRLKMAAARHFDPAPRAQIFLPEQNHCDQRGQRCDVHPVDLFEHGLIVEQADQEHRAQARHNPVDLPDVGTGKFCVIGRTPNLHHA